MKFFDFAHPWFDPVGVRIAVVALCFGWTLFEIANGAYIWASIFGFFSLAAIYGLFLTPRPDRNNRN